MRLLRKLGALSIAFGNIWSWVVILTGVLNNNIETREFLLSVSVIFATYFFGLFKLLGASKPYRVERVIAAPIISKATLKLNEEQSIYMTYEVKEDRVSEDDWKAFKVKLKDYAKNFLEKYYPTVVVDFEFRLLDQKLDNNLNGRHTALYSYFGDHDNYIYLSDWLVHASIYCDDFSIVVPMDFTQMYNIKGGTLTEKSTLFQFIVNIFLGVLPLFLFFAGITSSHSLFKKYNLSLNQLGLFVTYIGIMASVTLGYLLFKLVLSENVLTRLSASALLGGNVYLLFMLLLGSAYSLKKGNPKPDRFSAKK